MRIALCQCPHADLQSPAATLQHFENGTGFEAAIRAGGVTGVVDYGLRDLVAMPGTDRLTAAALAGVPQVIVLGPLADVSDAALDLLGKEVAEKAAASAAPVRIIAGSDTAAVLRESVGNWIYPPELFEEWELATGSRKFAEACVIQLLDLIVNVARSSGRVSQRPA